MFTYARALEAAFFEAMKTHSIIIAFLVLVALLPNGSASSDDERTQPQFQLRLITPSTSEIPLENQAQRFFDASIGIMFENPRDFNVFDSFCKYCTLCVGVARCVHLYGSSGDGFSTYKPVKRLKVPVDAFQQEAINTVNITLFNGWEPLASLSYQFIFSYAREESVSQESNELSSGVFPKDDVDPAAPLPAYSSSTLGIIPGLNLTFEYPPDGIVVHTPKMIVTMALGVDDVEKFNSQFNPIQDFLFVCYDLEKHTKTDGLRPVSDSGKYTRNFCSEMNEPNIKISGLGDGLYTLTSWLADNSKNNEMVVLTENASSTFEVRCNCNQQETWFAEGPVPPYLPYAERYKDLPTGHTAIPWKDDDSQLWIPPYKLLSPALANAWHREKRVVTLVVGVKVAATAFEYRSALRETWFNRKKHYADCAFWFIVGFPDPNGKSKITKDVIDRIINEAREHKDMLLGPHPDFVKAQLPFPSVIFNVKDSYYTLVEKTVTFMAFATMTYRFNYLFMCDEDIYLNADSLINVLREQGERFRFFAGQVWEKHTGRPMRPIRDHESKNYISYQHWKMRDLPPLAIGPHYLMSKDCVDYIVDNKKLLRGVGTLEDVSVTVWLFSIGVHPEHVKWFSNAKNGPCQEGLVSFADLKPKYIRLMHRNIMLGGKLCDGMKSASLAKGVVENQEMIKVQN